MVLFDLTCVCSQYINFIFLHIDTFQDVHIHHFQVRPKPSSQEDCVNQIERILQKEFKDQSGIIYTMTIKDAEQLAGDLRSRGLRVAPYHAQLEADLRSRVHMKWVKNTYQVILL